MHKVQGGALLLVTVLMAASMGAEAATVYGGEYGYIVVFPDGYEAKPSFGDQEKTHEIVYFSPKTLLRNV